MKFAINSSNKSFLRVFKPSSLRVFKPPSLRAFKHSSLRALAKQSRSAFQSKIALDFLTSFTKTAIQGSLIYLLLIHNLCYAHLVLRFQPEIDEKATKLGDVLLISETNVENSNELVNWKNLSLDSHPTPGEIITKTKILDWMTQQLGPFESTWQGKTQIRVKQPSQSSEKLLIEKAKAALIEKLGSNYLHVRVTPLSHIKDSTYPLEEIKTSINLPFPTPKRVCVWLSQGEKARIAVWFKVEAYAKVLVANHDIHYNTPLKKSLFTTKTRNIAGLNAPPALTFPAQIWLKSSMQSNTILLKNQLRQPPLILKGQHIKLVIHNHGITILMETIAQMEGYLGDIIQVKNPVNQKIFTAKIIDGQQAEMSAG